MKDFDEGAMARKVGEEQVGHPVTPRYRTSHLFDMWSDKNVGTGCETFISQIDTLEIGKEAFAPWKKTKFCQGFRMKIEAIRSRPVGTLISDVQNS